MLKTTIQFKKLKKKKKTTPAEKDTFQFTQTSADQAGELLSMQNLLQDL